MKRAPTYEEFLTLFPAFIDKPAPVVESALDFSTRLLDEGTWGDFLGDAIGLDAAHNLAMESLIGGGPLGAFKGAVGPITSVSAAGVSTSFANPEINSQDKGEDWYSKTAYGQRFLRLRQVVIPMGYMCA